MPAHQHKCTLISAQGSALHARHRASVRVASPIVSLRCEAMIYDQRLFVTYMLPVSFDLAPSFLSIALGILSLALGFQTLVPGQFTGLVLDRAGCLLNLPPDLVFIYDIHILNAG